MPKSSSTELFELIKSMTKSEKRHFKLLSPHTHDESEMYLQLFNAIEKQQIYDEKKILQECKRIKRLPLLKVRLYDLILKRLYMYRSAQRSSEAYLRNFLNHAQILFEKGLFGQAIKIVKRAKSIAVKNEHFWYHAELIIVELKIAQARNFKFTSSADLEILQGEMIRVVKNYSDTQGLRILSYRAQERNKRQGYARIEEHSEDIRKILQHPLLNSENKPSSYIGKYYFNAIPASYYFAKRDFVNAHKHTKKVIEVLESSPEKLKENINPYMNALANFSTCQKNIGDYKGLEQTIKKINSLEINSPRERYALYFYISSISLAFYFREAKFNEGMLLVKEIEEKLKGEAKEYLSIGATPPLFYNMACIYFATQQYTEANKYLNAIINSKAPDFYSDVYCFAMILRLIIQFELGNNTLIEYMVKNTYRYLYKRNRLYEFETLLLRYIRKTLPKVKSRNDLMQSLKKLQAEIDKTLKKPSEAIVLEYFDFSSWIESKLQNKSFAEIIQKKNKRN